MKINEIFYSIQGEGKWSGLPNIFIRTTGCNLRCSFCDTKYAYKSGKNLDIQEIKKEIKKYNCKKICLTGGEPLLQDETYDLIDELIKNEYLVLIETNGSIAIDKILNENNIIISLDIKCPSSNMDSKMNLKNISYLKEKDQLKFVINNLKDYQYAKNIISKYKAKCEIFFQPVWGAKINLAKHILNENLNVKLGIQIHKILNLR